jgi:hypothetical protein
MKFWVDITNSAGVKYGDGPIITATSWHQTARVDQAGTFSFSMPANDPRAALVSAKRYAHVYTRVNGTVTEVGAGIIDKVTINSASNGNMLEVSGDDLLRELTFLRVGQLCLGADGTPPTTVYNGPQSIVAIVAALGWTLDVVNGFNVTITPVFLSIPK